MAALKLVEPGVWRAGDTEGKAGTYAFVVGVSQYDRLDGSRENLGLSSLYVSALTAFRFFKYLAEAYVFEGGPIFEATLLLSPTEEEAALIRADSLGVDPALVPRPTLQTIKEQLQTWHRRLAALDAGAMTKSRTFFFFSGHGLELDPDRQLLLSSDYPGPGRVFNDAVSTRNLWQGLGALPIPHQFFFVDACRSDVPSLYGLAGSQGTVVFDEWRGGHKAEAPIFYASASGDVAWQPTSATCIDDTSFYGKALLDALLVRDPAFQPDCSASPCQIRVFPLYTYVHKALQETLRAKNINNTRPVGLGGAVFDSVVSHWQRPPGAGDTGGGGGAPPLLPWAMHFLQDESAYHPVSRSDSLREVASTRLELSRRFDRPELERRLGNRAFAAFVADAEVYEWVPSSGWVPSRDDFAVLATERTEDGSASVVDLVFDEYRKFRWIQTRARSLTEREASRDIWYGFLVPMASQELPILSLELVAGSGWREPELLDAVLRLSEHNHGWLGKAARLWRLYADNSALGALQAIRDLASETGTSSQNAAYELLGMKYESPLAATIGALVLARTELDDKIRAWYENLALNVAESSDAAVFSLRSLVLRGEYSPRNARKYVERIAKWGTPVTTEACAYLMNYVGDLDEKQSLLRETFDVPGDGPLQPFKRIASMLKPGGLFTTVASRHPDPPIHWVRHVMR